MSVNLPIRQKNPVTRAKGFEVLTFNQIRHLHGLEFEALCHKYNERELYHLMAAGERWDFWPESVVLYLDFDVNPEGEPTMIQLNQETLDAINCLESECKEFHLK